MVELLDKLIPQYATNKAELDSYKKICEKENAKIKAVMKDLTLSHYEIGQYRATRTVQERTKVNEDVLISIINSSPEMLEVAKEFGIIKTKEYIDFDALENAIYKEQFSQSQLIDMQEATETKEVITLKVTKRKADKKR